MYLNSWLLTSNSAYELIFHCLFVLVGAGILHWIVSKILKRLHIYFVHTPNVWDDALIHALSLPLELLIWIFAVTLSVEYFLTKMHHLGWAREVLELRTGSFVLILIWFFWRYTILVERSLAKLAQSRRKIDINTIATIGRFFRAGLGIIVLLMILEALNVPISGVIAFGGGGALAMGIAAQHILANWFGGLMIFLDKPFKPEEWISSPDRNIEGKVVEIGWRTTKIIGADNRPRYIPNSIFSQVIITNSQRVTHRTIEATISLRYEDVGAVEEIVKSIDAMLRAYPLVDLDERYMVHFVGFDNSALNIHFLCSVKELNFNAWRNMQQDIFLKIIDIIMKNGAQFYYPSVITHLCPNDFSIQKKSATDNK